MGSWIDGYWYSNDGLRLHYRDYPGSDSRPPIICIPGLTRNARDFEGVAERLSPQWRLICVDLRGRGESGYAEDAFTYVPPVYLEDIEALIEQLGLPRLVVFGTSLGGMLTMLLAMRKPGCLAGALLNDVGPELDQRGIERIRTYVGRPQSWPSWAQAADYFAQAQREVYPGWQFDDWLAHAKRLCRLSANGRITFDYDMRIAEPFRIAEGDTGFDMWSAFAALGDVPVLLVRGALSDLLSAETAGRMAGANPRLDYVTVANVGHAPLLEEAEAATAIDRLLAQLA